MGFVPKGFSLSISADDGGALSRGFPALAAKLGARLQGSATLRARGGLHRSATLLAELRPCAIDRSTVGAGNTAAAHSTTATSTRLRGIAPTMMTPATMVATQKSVKDTHDCSSFLSYKNGLGFGKSQTAAAYTVESSWMHAQPPGACARRDLHDLGHLNRALPMRNTHPACRC